MKTMTRTSRISFSAAVLMLLAACAGTSAPSKQEMILGSWQGEIQGQAITLIYSETEITVDSFGISFPYAWLDDDRIRMDAMGQEIISTVEFPTENEMVQSSDQGEQRLTRVQ